MKLFPLTYLAVLILLPAATNPVNAQPPTGTSHLGGVGGCIPPEPPYPYKLSKTDPLYETALRDHQASMEGLEDYLNCIEHERERAYTELENSFDLFIDNFGEDAVLKYVKKREAE